MTMTNASGQYFLALSATFLMIGRFTPTRSSRDCPGFRGMPAVMMRTFAPATSSQFELPRILASLPLRVVACSKSRAFPWANFSLAGMSNSTTSPSCRVAARWASSPPILPAPIKPILVLAMSYLSARGCPGGRLGETRWDGRATAPSGTSPRRRIPASGPRQRRLPRRGGPGASSVTALSLLPTSARRI